MSLLKTIKRYLLNCFLLTLPILLWNILFSDKLPPAFQPDVFWKDIPPLLAAGENWTRIIVFTGTALMPLNVSSTVQKQGLFLYIGGTVVYFIAWIMLMYYPETAWSNSILGFTAPAYTPLIWLAGIGLIGDTMYFNIYYNRWIFLSVSILFLSFHITHTLTIYFRMHP